jgi:predicted RNA binding protein YcfA (HicA-like mRNA interferase family)
MAGYSTKINKICKVLKDDGFAVARIESKHPKIVFIKNSFQGVVVIPSTPSDTNAIKHVIKDFRKKLNAGGFKTMDKYCSYLLDSNEFLEECVAMYKDVSRNKV